MKGDTLELLVFMPMTGDLLDEAAALSWRGFPPTASWGSPLVRDIDLGDWECKDLPSFPTGPGLWLLRWEWIPTKEEGFDTAQYADTCTWSRPTSAELAALGALPTPAPAEAGVVTDEQCDALIFEINKHRDGRRFGGYGIEEFMRRSRASLRAFALTAAPAEAGEDDPTVLHKCDDWHEDHGPVLWWVDGEPPHCGTPLDSDFPHDLDGEHSCLGWSRLVVPPALTAARRIGMRP